MLVPMEEHLLEVALLQLDLAMSLSRVDTMKSQALGRPTRQSYLGLHPWRALLNIQHSRVPTATIYHPLQTRLTSSATMYPQLLCSPDTSRSQTMANRVSTSRLAAVLSLTIHQTATMVKSSEVSPLNILAPTISAPRLTRSL